MFGVANKGLPYRRSFLVHYKKTLLIGVAFCVLLSLLIGCAMEFWFQPGVSHRIQRFDSSMTAGFVAVGDIDQDGFAERMRESRSKLHGASMTIEYNTPLQRRPAKQLYFPGDEIVLRPHFFDTLAGAPTLCLLTRDSSAVYLCLRRWPFGSGIEEADLPLFHSDQVPVSIREAPWVIEANRLEHKGRELLYLSLFGHFEGWRGGVLIDPLSLQIVDLFPNAIAPAPYSNQTLLTPDGHSLYAMGGHATRNGRELGGVNDGEAPLFLMDPDSGFVEQIRMGMAHTALNAHVLQDRRRIYLQTKQVFDRVDVPETHNLVVLDAWKDSVLTSARLAGLENFCLIRQNHALLVNQDGRLFKFFFDSGRLVPAGHLRGFRDSILIGLVQEAYWLAFRPATGYRLYSPEGQPLVEISTAGNKNRILLESVDGTLENSRIHVSDGQLLQSFTISHVPFVSRLMANPAIPPAFAVSFVLLLVYLSYRVRRQERVLSGMLSDGVTAAALTDDQGELLYANTRFRELVPGDLLDRVIGHARARESGFIDSWQDGRLFRWIARETHIQASRIGWYIQGIDDTNRMTREHLGRLESFAGILTHNLGKALLPAEFAVVNLQESIQEAGLEKDSGFREAVEEMQVAHRFCRERIKRFLALIKVGEERESVDLGTLLENACTDLGLDAMSTIDVTSSRQAELLPVYVATASVQAMIESMLRNAVEAMRRKGTLHFLLQQEEEMAVLRIEDNGPGIPPDVLDRIWEPGFTTKDEGSGFGLFLSRHIAHEHGGELTVRNKEIGGAAVYLRLPLVRQEQLLDGVSHA